MFFQSSKECVKMIKVLEPEPSHIHHVVEDRRENKACYSGFELPGEYGASRRLRCNRSRRSPLIPTGIDLSAYKHLKNQPVEPHAALSAHVSAVNQGGEIPTQGIAMQDAGILNGHFLGGGMGGGRGS